MRNYFKRIFGGEKKGFVFTTRNLAYHTGNGDRIARGRDDGGSQSMGSFIAVSDLIPSSATTTSMGNSTAAIYIPPGQYVSGDPTPRALDERKEVEPKAVFEEIKKEEILPDFGNLDEKIRVVEERIKVLKEHLDDSHLIDEHKALFFLENRRKYLSTRKKYPLDWAMTNREAVDDLCKRYKLQIVPLKQYYTLVPNQGIKEIERYTKAYQKITGENPIFELVIKDIKPETAKTKEEADEKVKEKSQQRRKDRDPILLANSPIGDFMFVLGAWDDEVEFVDEIIYNGK